MYETNNKGRYDIGYNIMHASTLFFKAPVVVVRNEDK